jgi:hypothetical protein
MAASASCWLLLVVSLEGVVEALLSAAGGLLLPSEGGDRVVMSDGDPDPVPDASLLDAMQCPVSIWHCVPLGHGPADGATCSLGNPFEKYAL